MAEGSRSFEIGVVAPPCGASRPGSEFRMSAVVMTPPCGASRLRSEFRVSAFVRPPSWSRASPGRR